MMRWKTKKLYPDVWIRRFAWIPRVIRETTSAKEYIWLKPYEERRTAWEYLGGGYRVELERRLPDGTSGNIVKYVLD